MKDKAPSTRPGMGAVPHRRGTTFRVWAPHAEAVFVTGTFDEWAGDRTALARDGDGSSGTWSVDVAGVEPGAEYRFTIRTADGDLSRIDPYARHVTSSIGNGIVYDPAAFDWGDDAFATPTWDDLVIYEMHVGSFAPSGDRQGTFDDARQRLHYLERLGVSAIQVMPPFEFAGDISWGYNPSHLFAIEFGLWRARRVQALRARGACPRHRRHRRRRLQPSRPVRPGPVAVRWLGRGRVGRDLLLQR